MAGRRACNQGSIFPGFGVPAGDMDVRVFAAIRTERRKLLAMALSPLKHGIDIPRASKWSSDQWREKLSKIMMSRALGIFCKR